MIILAVEKILHMEASYACTLLSHFLHFIVVCLSVVFTIGDRGEIDRWWNSNVTDGSTRRPLPRHQTNILTLYQADDILA